MKQLTQYLILIALVIGSSVMLLNYIAPMTASIIFCFSLAGLLIKIAKTITNL